VEIPVVMVISAITNITIVTNVWYFRQDTPIGQSSAYEKLAKIEKLLRLAYFPKNPADRTKSIKRPF
jgi:hypothetical protein